MRQTPAQVLGVLIYVDSSNEGFDLFNEFKMKVLQLVSIALLMLITTASVKAQFAFVTNNGVITITGHLGTDSSVVIPGSINGCPVTSIGSSAFLNQSTVTNVTMPVGVTHIGDPARP